MNNDALPEDWEILRSWLPADLDERARQQGFFERARGLNDAECWLRLILMHVAGGLSLAQTVLRARELGLADVSGVALFKRLRKAQDWLQDLCQHLLGEQQRRLGQSDWPSDYRVRIIDATDVREPGCTGTDWRIHYSIRLPQLVCDHYEVSDHRGGEKLGRFRFSPRELIVADRGYSHAAGAARVLASGAALLLRWSPAVLSLKAVGGRAFPLLPRLRRLSRQAVGEWPVQFEWEGKTYDVRLCALRKSRTASERAQLKVLRTSRRKGTQVDPQSLERAQYLMVLTSLPATKFSARQALELYRCRWQVELAFKRLKSLLGAGHVPKSSDLSSRSWMQAKILTSLLLERLLWEAKVFSPWGYPLPNLESLATAAGGA